MNFKHPVHLWNGKPILEGLRYGTELPLRGVDRSDGSVCNISIVYSNDDDPPFADQWQVVVDYDNGLDRGFRIRRNFTKQVYADEWLGCQFTRLWVG